MARAAGGGQNPFRTYTVRRVDADAREVDVDFVVHHDAGPAGSWADDATPGDELVLVGPDERSPASRVGLDWHPGTARRLLLAGDETAAPAICGILESLDPRCDVDAFIEVPAAADILSPRVPPGVRLTGAPRRCPARRAARRGGRRMDASAPDPACACRSAAPAGPRGDRRRLRTPLGQPRGHHRRRVLRLDGGESGTVKTLRRHLVTGCGVDRGRVAFMGYWRLGQAERSE